MCGVKKRWNSVNTCATLPLSIDKWSLITQHPLFTSGPFPFLLANTYNLRCTINIEKYLGLFAKFFNLLFVSVGAVFSPACAVRKFDMLTLSIWQRILMTGTVFPASLQQVSLTARGGQYQNAMTDNLAPRPWPYKGTQIIPCANTGLSRYMGSRDLTIASEKGCTH